MPKHDNPHKDAPTAAGDSLSVAAGSELKLGGSVSFDYTVSSVTLPATGEPGSASVKIQAFRADGAQDWMTAGYADRTFVLGWAEGPRHCVATLYYLDTHTENDLASVEFDVAG